MRFEGYGHRYESTDVEEYVKEIKLDMAHQRLDKEAQKALQDCGEERIIYELENGCDLFSKDDLKYFKNGDHHKIGRGKSMSIESYLRALEIVYKDAGHINNRRCGEAIKKFPTENRIRKN